MNLVCKWFGHRWKEKTGFDPERYGPFWMRECQRCPAFEYDVNRRPDGTQYEKPL